MKARSTRQVLVLFCALACLLSAAQSLGAASTTASQSPATGPLGFAFTNLTVPVFDLSGAYQFEHQVALKGAGTVDLTLACVLEQDAAGRLHGTGATNILVGTNVLQANYTVSGKVSGGGGKVTHAVMSVRWTAQGMIGGASDTATISVQYNFDVMPQVLSGQARGKVRFAQSGSGTIKAAVKDVLLPETADGSWAVQMDLQPPGGSGSVMLSSGRTLPLNPKVSFASRTGQERIKLTGSGTGKGISLNITYLPASGTLSSMSGKALGQKVAVKNATVAGVSQVALADPTSAGFAGEQACLECHTPIQQTLNFTRHAQVGVQCENCHGPAAAHAANDYDPQSRPIIPYDGKTCGTCHSGPRHPIYEEWSASEHAEVAIDLTPPDRTTSCGRCHSGSVRVNLVDGTPVPTVDVNVPLGCPTCHQPHQLTGQPDQLRNPLYSTNDYYITTTSVFTNQYNPNVNLCAQCHNDRGAAWTDTSRPPHESPQYNILIGTVGELASGLPPNDPAYHALFITNQCVGCHMQRSAQTTNSPAVTGHQFTVNSYVFCAQCHGSAVNASNLMVFARTVITMQIQTLQSSLDEWATNNAPPELSAKYGTRAWEYTVPGALSPGGPGPNASEQALIPDNIKKARFDLYLILYDGSFGTHNGPYSTTLLGDAQALVDQELGP